MRDSCYKTKKKSFEHVTFKMIYFVLKSNINTWKLSVVWLLIHSIYYSIGQHLYLRNVWTEMKALLLPVRRNHVHE